MDERQVLELMRDVAYCASHRTGTPLANLLDEIGGRLSALPDAAQATPDPTRCVVCDWTLAESREQGCVAGDCSYRPAQGTPEHDRIKDRLRAQMSAPAAAQADGEEGPVGRLSTDAIETCISFLSVNGENDLVRAARVEVEALRARPAPSQEIVERFLDAARRIDWKQVGLNGGGCFRLEDDGRFCLRAHHWAGHTGEKALHLYEPLYVAMTRLAKALDVTPAPSHALVEAADALSKAARTIHEEDAADEVEPRARESVLYEALARYEAARASLPAAKREGGA